jgi:hypothetical protein
MRELRAKIAGEAKTKAGLSRPNCHQVNEYLTIAEVAALLKVSPKRVMNMMCSGIFTEGLHFFRPRGLKPRFKASAVQAYVEGKDQPQQSNVIQLRKGSTLRIPVAR